jgi:hypothetical protein
MTRLFGKIYRLSGRDEGSIHQFWTIESMSCPGEDMLWEWNDIWQTWSKMSLAWKKKLKRIFTSCRQAEKRPSGNIPSPNHCRNMKIYQSPSWNENPPLKLLTSPHHWLRNWKQWHRKPSAPFRIGGVRIQEKSIRRSICDLHFSKKARNSQ